ncbi:hypothetical protein N9271_00690 [Pseudomonadales bacterium]|jgi:hypothetical protein|nr:hypothetical protein [Pseudomonadales bacterium]MDB4420818.1 hypothetical protein [Pseudomonadales bacterium]MDB4542431.1 hypothetical protein [Pseudomonadales bacterium]
MDRTAAGPSINRPRPYFCRSALKNQRFKSWKKAPCAQRAYILRFLLSGAPFIALTGTFVLRAIQIKANQVLNTKVRSLDT